MIRTFWHFSFWIPAILFVVHQIIQKGLGIQFIFFDYYLDPFCFSALTLQLFVWERNLFFNQLTILKLEVVVLVLFLIVYSEFVLPYLFSQFIYDGWDIVAIILGGIWFYSFNSNLIKNA